MPNRPRVLIVDDNPVTRDTLCAFLAQHGVNAAGAASGHGAFSQLPVFRPDVLMLDLWMPGMDGQEFLTSLRRQPGPWQTIPVVIASAASLETIGRALVAIDGAPGRTSVLQKPFDPDELLSLLRSMFTAQAPTFESETHT
jgi:two-component system OmpR family response regulator